MGKLFGNLFGWRRNDLPCDVDVPERTAVDRKRFLRLAYNKGDFIGQKYQVYEVLGAGGFGIVYLVYSHETKSVFALKSLRDEHVHDEQMRERFRKEAQVWVDLGRHPYIVRAFFVEEVAGRLYIAMEYIAPNEQGLTSLQDHLTYRAPDLVQTLRWSVQFCYGMEYAYSQGIRCHRDIKPANILISQDRRVKISDFGLAGISMALGGRPSIQLSFKDGKAGLSRQTLEGVGFGTPTHMPPEQFISAAHCDQRSDIYSFGIVLYEMASGGKLPFFASPPQSESEEEARCWWKEMYKLHSKAPLPKLNSRILPIVQRCLEKEPGRRYQTFQKLREDLEALLKREAGEVVKPMAVEALEAWEWSNKGGSLATLGRYEEALFSFNKALDLDPSSADAWCGKGNTLLRLGRHEEALFSFNKALDVDPSSADAWCSKGDTLLGLGRHEEALQCLDTALQLNPRDSLAWNSKGVVLERIGDTEGALRCYDRALEVDAHCVEAWRNKGNIMYYYLRRIEDALRCYENFLQLEPRNPEAWASRANCLRHMSQFTEAIVSYRKALDLDPRDYLSWHGKAFCEEQVGRPSDAIHSYEQVISSAPRHAAAQINFARQRLQELKGRSRPRL